MAERPLYTLYKNLKAQNYDVPDDYNKFESALTRDGKGGADNRHAIYENLKAQNFDVPDTYERFYSALFEPRSKTSSRAKGGSVPMTAADRARFSAGAQAISASAQQTMDNAGRYNRLKQRKQKQQKDFGRVNLGTHQTPYGGDANNVVKDDFAYNPETGKAGAYVTSNNENAYTFPDAEQTQAILDKQNEAYQVAVDTGEIPSVFDVRDKNGNYDLQENIGKNGTYLTEEGAQKQFDKKLADAYARKKEIEALITEDNRQHGNPLLSYGASIGASNGRTAEQSDYRNKLATSLSLVTEQIGALEAVKQYPTSSWGEDALKALDNTAFTAKTWDFGLTDFATMGQMERIKTKMDNNIPLSGSDKMLLKSKLGADAAAALEDEKMGNIYRWTKIAGQSLPFMADFFLTGGYGGITKGISRGALKFAAKRGMGKVSAAILKNTGIVAGDVVGSYAMAGTEQALKTGADIMQRHLGNLYQDEKGDYKFGTFDENGNLLHEGGESMGTALYKGLTSAMVENYTEKLFGHNYGIKKGAVNFMEKHGMNASAEFFKNIGKSGWYTNSKKWMEKFGINGFAEEVMEEEIGIPLHALLDGEGKVSDLLDARQQLDIIGGMAISVGSMYAMGAGSRPVKGIYNRAQYYRFRNKVNVADSDAQNLLGDNWADIKDKIDNATNEQMGGVLADILRQRDSMTKEQINAAVNYGINLMKMRGYNIAKTSEMNAKEITNEPTTPEEQHQTDIDNAYSEGHDADDADKHDIQIQQEDQMKTLAAALGISEQQLSAMSDEELESLTGQDDKLDKAIYDYQLSSARYQGVVDDAQDKVDLAAHQAEQRVDMYTDQSRGSVRNATIKASGGLEDYGVYIISGNIATHDDGSIDVSNSDDMILYYDPTTNSVEHADALMFAELGEELPADDVKAQAVVDAKEIAIKEVAGIIDGTVEVGSQFSVTGADSMEHTYEVLADYGDGTAAISIDGNVVENPYSFADLQNLKDLEDQKRLEAAKAQREQMEKERAEQQNQEIEETQPSFDFNQILNDNGNVVLVDVLDKDGNTKYPDSRLFLIRDAGAKAKVVELKSDGSLVPHAVSKKNVSIITSMSLDEYKQAMAESSMIEDSSGENRGEIEVETPTIEGETAASTEETAAPESTETAATAITLEDGTIVPMLEDGNPDFSKLTAAQTAELYDSQFGEDADSIVSGYVSDAKKALDKANNMTVKGKTFVEQKAAKDAKEAAIADAQAAYDSAIAIRDAYNERQLAKVEDTPEGRKNLIEKARRKFARLKSSVKNDAEAVAQLYKDTVGSLLHRLYDGTGIDVTDTIPLTAEEYVASNLGAHTLNYEGTETSKGVKQETGLSREDFAKTQLLAADGKGTTIDNLVHSLWENRPSNLESLDTQDIRNALIGVLTSGFMASESRNYIENLRIAQAESALEEQKKAADSAAFAEENKAETEQQTETAPELSNEQQKAKEDGEKLGFPAIDKEGEPINEYVIELANWAKEQGLEIDPTSKSNSYADLFLMCKDGFGVSTLVPDEGENINQVVYFPDNVQDFDQLWKLQEEFNAGRDLKHSSNIDSEITEGATFYEADTAREFKEFVDNKVEEHNKVFGEQIPEEDLPFSARENGTQQTTSERAADVEKNKVDDVKVVDNIVGQQTRKAFERLAKMMGANIQWQYSDKLGNGWIQETKDVDGNVHRTIFITLDSSITEGAQFIFGHEMTHQIKNLNPAAYNELTQLVLDTYGSDAFDKAVNETMKRYSDAGFSGRARDYYAEEVVADAVGEMIRDLNLAHTLAMKMSHPLLAAIHEILQKIKLAFFGTEYSDVTKNIIRSIEQAYVKTANMEAANAATQEGEGGQRLSLRTKPEPKKTQKVYKLMRLGEDGKLYPLFIGSGEAIELGKWYDADSPKLQDLTSLSSKDYAGTRTAKKDGASVKEEYHYGAYIVNNKTGEAMSLADFKAKYSKQFARMGNNPNKKAVDWATDNGYRWIKIEEKNQGQSRYGGEARSYYNYGINGSGSVSIFAMRPGWHAGSLPTMRQIGKGSAKNLRDDTFVWVDGEIPAEIDYNEEAQKNADKDIPDHIPTDGYYLKATNANKEASQADKVGWYVAGAFRANRIMSDKETRDIIDEWNAAHPDDNVEYDWKRESGKDFNAETMSLEDTPKFSLKVYHGSGADFTEFDFDHMGEGAGSQVFGWGGYVTSSKKIGKSYATLMDNDPSKAYYRIQRSNGTRFAKKYPTLESFLHGDKQIAMNDKFTEQEKIDYYNEMKKLAEPYHNLYEVDIPENNGSNYLDWDKPLSKEQKDAIREGLEHIGVDIKKLESKGQSLERTGENIYNSTLYIGLTGTEYDLPERTKGISKFLSSVGFTGIKYKAGRNFGGAKKGDTNYVIFNPEDMQIAEHTKFSIKTYHGSQASFDHFDHSFLGSGEGAQAYGWGTYVSEVEGESTLGDYINDDIDGGNLEELTNAASYRAADPMRKEAIDNVRNAIQKKAKTITMYRSVPSDVKEGSFRNGDWVTPSRAYAVDNAKLHGWGDDYNIIEQKVPVDDVWFDGNDIAEWGYGREKDYINDTDFAYKNTKNNKKLLDAVTYDDNGNVIPLSQRFNEKNKDVRFSLKDEKTMFGMHNISIDKLRKAIKQGGFAAPSMGVVDSKNGIYSDYGEITLIPKAEKLAKRTGKNAGTFTADAWTPTYPQVERIMNKQGEKAFNTDMNVKLGDVDNGIYSNIRESWKGYLSSGDVRDGLYWHYLFDKGMNPETIYQTGKYENDITYEVMRISDNGNKTDYTDKEVAELIQLMNKATGKDNDVDAQREKLKARIASAEKKGNHLLVALKKKRLEELEGVENFYIAADFVNDVVRNNRKNGKVDVHETMDAAKEKVENDKKLSDGFPSWLDKKTEEYGVEEMLYNGTTPSGKPKYIPNTIDNAVKLMKKQGVAGGYTAFGSELGVFIAKNSPEVNTLAAMKNAKDKLIPFGDERHNQIKDKITKEFLELSDEIRVGSNNRYAFDDSGVSRMVELTDHKGNEKEYLKKAYNVEVSDEWMDRYNKLLDTIKNDYKVFYFETKFMRPYGLDEFEKAIVPSDTPSDVVDALKKAGIDVSSYERGNAEDRQKVTMDAINSSDNIRFSLAGERGAAAADKAEERTFRMDNLSVARKMEEEKKDAKAIKMATGGSVASAKEFAKKRIGADANDIQRTLENLKDREKGTEYEQNLKDRLAEYKEGLKWIDSLDEDYLTQGNANRYDVDIPDDNGSNYLDWENPMSEEQINAIRDALAKKGVDVPSWEKRGFKLDLPFKDVYAAVLPMMMRYKPEDVSQFLSSVGFTGIKYPAGTIFGGAKEDDYNYVIFDENNANIVGNTRFSLRYDQFEHDLNQWKKDNNLPKDAQRPTIPQRNAGESAVDFLRRVDEYRKQMALWKTAPTYEQHLLSDDTALGEFNRELQRGSVLKRIAFQDSMLAIRKAQEAIMKEVGVDRLNMAEDAYTSENRSHGKGKNEFEEYNNEFLQPLRKAYHQMKKILGDSYDNVRIYMMAKHGLERDAQMAFKKSLDADFEDVAQRSAAYRAYKGDMNRITNDSDLEFGRVDFNTWRQRDNALRTKYSPSYMDYRYDENGIAYDYSGLSALFGGSDFEEAAHKLVRDIESSHVAEVQDLWNATNAATKKILRDGYKAGMMSKDTYLYVRDMYSHYIPLRGWDGTTADQVWDYIGGGKGAFNQTLKTANGRTSIADDPIAYIENMAESGILLNNKNWVKQHLMLLAQNHPTSLLTLSKAWYVKSTDANGNEEWIPATPQITSQMNSNQVKAAIDAFEQKMEQMAQTGDATQQRDGLNIAYPQTHSEEREHEVRVMKDGEEYVIYVNGDPQLAQAMNNTRAHRVREIQSGKLDRAAAWLGRKMAAAYTSLSPLFIPSNYFRDLTMTLASTAIREDAKYNYLLRKNLATSWNLGFMLRNYQNGKLREKVSNGNATPKEQMFYDFMMNGGETGFVSSLDVEDLKKKFKNDLKDLDKWKANPVKAGHTIMDSIEFLNRMIEDSNRFAVYMTSIQYGRSIDEAVNDAKDVTLNFNRKGTGEYGWQMIRNLYLFINPAVQSLQTLGALAKHHPFKFTAVTASWLASGVLVPVVNAALMSLLGGDDDKDKYWQFTKWDRRNNLIMWVPFTHEYVKIPLAQEFRAFYGIGDMIASKVMGGELAEESWSQYAEDLLGQVVDMLPLDPTGYDGNIAVSLMPNAIRPVFELAFNVDFTGKPLFKDTEYNKYDPNFTKAYVGTPDWLVRASRMMNSIGNDYPDVQQNKWDALGDPRFSINNPAVVDHVLSSYLGGAYTMGSQVLGLLTKSLNDKKEIKMADIPLLSKFVSNPDDRPVTKKQGDEFWDMKENHDRAANTLSKLKKQAKVDGDYSLLERFYGSEEYKQYKQDDVKVKKYEEDKKKERAEESGEEYRPHKLNAEDIYKAHATPKDDFEDLKLKQLYTKLNGFKSAYDLLVDTAPSQSDGYYNANKAAIDAIDEISLDKQEISELKKGFLDDGKDACNAEDMKQIRELRKKILAVLEKANKVVVASQKAKTEK